MEDFEYLLVFGVTKNGDVFLTINEDENKELKIKVVSGEKEQLGYKRLDEKSLQLFLKILENISPNVAVSNKLETELDKDYFNIAKERMGENKNV